jgi:hypothetical protein
VQVVGREGGEAAPAEPFLVGAAGPQSQPEVLPLFLCIDFCARKRKKRYTKEEEYRSAEGRMPTANSC